MNNPFSSTDGVDEREPGDRDDVNGSPPENSSTESPPEETPRHHASSYRVIDRPPDHRIDEVVQLLTDPTNGVVTRAGAIVVVKRQTEQEIHGFVKELDTLLRQRETALIGIDHNTPMLRTLATHVGVTLAIAPHNQEHVSTLCRHLTALVADDRVSGLGSARRFEVPVSPEAKAQESSRVLDALENLRGDPLHHIGNDDWDFVAFTAPQEWVSAAEETLSAFAPVIDQVVWDRPRITVCGFVFEDTEIASDDQAETPMRASTNGNQSTRSISADSSQNGSHSTEPAQEHRSTRPDPSSTAEGTDLTPPESPGAPLGTSATPDPETVDPTTQNDSPDTPPPTGGAGAPAADSETTTSSETPATTSDDSLRPESGSDFEEDPPPTGERPSPTDSAPAEASESEHAPDTLPSPPPPTGDDPTESTEVQPTAPSSDPDPGATDEECLPQSQTESDASTSDNSQGRPSADGSTSAPSSQPSSAPDPDDEHTDSQRAADSSSDSDSGERTRSPPSADEDTPSGPSPETDQPDTSSASQPTTPPPIPEKGNDSEQSRENTTDRRTDPPTVPSASSSSTPTPLGDDDESGSTGSSSGKGTDETAPVSSPPQSASTDESAPTTSSASTSREDDDPVSPTSSTPPISDDESGLPSADTDNDETLPETSPTSPTEPEDPVSSGSSSTPIPSPPGGVGPGLVPAGDAPASQDPGVVDIDEHVLNEISSHAVAHDGEGAHDSQEVYATLYCDDQGLIRHSHMVEDDRFLENRRSSISFKKPFYQHIRYLAQIYQNISSPHRLCGDVHSHPEGIPKQSSADKTFSQCVWNNPRRNHNFIIALDDPDNNDPSQWTVTNDGKEVQARINGHLLRIRAFAGGTNEPKQIRVHTTMGI